jgi:hypothetical protein
VAALESAQVARGEISRRFGPEIYAAATGAAPSGPVS